MKDYIITGLGLAGIAFCEELEKNGKSYIVIDNGTENSSTVAAGVYNPVILKRLTMPWEAGRQMQIIRPFYKNLEKKLNVKLDYRLPVYRIFNSVSEQNLWFEATDKPHLSVFLSPEIIPNNNPYINAPLGYGEVLHTGYIDTNVLITAYRKHLKDTGKLLTETFDYDKLNLTDSVSYKEIKASAIVFAEGFGMKNNPFFKELPMVGSKGEVLTIKAPQLKADTIIKSSVFIIPLGNDLYRVGATYNFKDKTTTCTEEAKNELLTKLKKMISCPFDVVHHKAGIRPTVTDRKPLLGRHKDFKNVALLNGLGTRGVLIAPYAASMLFAHLENDVPLPKEIDLGRF